MNAAKNPRGRRRMQAGIGLAAALVLAVAAFAAARMMHRASPAGVPVSGLRAATPPRTSAPPNAKLSKHAEAQIAALAEPVLPAFDARTLPQGATNDPFAQGMDAYVHKDCALAIHHLDAVAPSSGTSTAAHFYAGACRLRLHFLAGARRDLERITSESGAAHLEEATYMMAQVELAQAHAAAAAEALERTVGLHGEYEQKAAAQLAALNRISPGPASPGSK